MEKKFDYLWKPLVEIFFPEPVLKKQGCYELKAPFCGRCGQPYGTELMGAWNCSNCSEEECFYEKARALYQSRGTIRKAVHYFKYEGSFWLRKHLIGWLKEGYEQFFKLDAYTALISVPLFARRQRWREFNQAEILAKGLAREIRLPVWNCLKRIRETETQTHLDRLQRRKNVKDAFRLAKGYNVRDNSYLMIDDVFTTGSTVNECARVLKQHGASKVDILTVARG